MKHFILLLCCVAIAPACGSKKNKKTDERTKTQLFGRTDEEGNRRGLITGRKKFIQHGKRDENVEAQLLPRRNDEDGDRRGRITGRKKFIQ